MKLAPEQITPFLALLRTKGLDHQGYTPMRKESVTRHLTEEGLREEQIAEVWAALPPAPERPKPADPAPPAKVETAERSKEEIAAFFSKAKGADTPKKSGLKEPAKRIELKPENQFRIYQPAPVVAVNQYGTVRWVADGRQHKAGDLIKPRAFQGKLTVRFRYNGEQVERLVGFMLETVGWVKRRAKKKASV